MKRLVFVFLTILVLGLGGAFYYTSQNLDSLLEDGTILAFDKVVAKAESVGLDVIDLGYDDVKLRGPGSIGWTEIQAHFKARGEGEFDSDREIFIEIADMSISLIDFIRHRFRFLAKNVKIERRAGDREALNMSRSIVKTSEIVIEFPLNYFNLLKVRKDFKKTLQELAHFMRNGTTDLYVKFHANSLFGVANKPFVAKVWVEHRDDHSRLLMDKKDVEKISKLLDEDLTESEIDLFAENPLKVPQLIRIRDYAESKAKMARKQDPSLSEDAYKHVLWSYLLTKAYGLEFAEKVTDAHEYGSETNTREDHIMDFNNNEMGRRYAALEKSEKSLLNLVRSDKEVIRSVKEIPSGKRV